MTQKLEWLNGLPENICRAKLAELRKGVGHAPGDIPILFGTLFTDFPEELYGFFGEPSREEWAIYIALTMFALHQQGHDLKTDWMHQKDMRLGIAVRKLAPGNDDSELDRIRNRFNKMATSSDMRELANHIRGIINLLRTNDIKLDYVNLAVDLYRYSSTVTQSNVRLKWGEDFYRLTK